MLSRASLRSMVTCSFATWEIKPSQPPRMACHDETSLKINVRQRLQFSIKQDQAYLIEFIHRRQVICLFVGLPEQPAKHCAPPRNNLNMQKAHFCSFSPRIPCLKPNPRRLIAARSLFDRCKRQHTKDVFRRSTEIEQNSEKK